MIQNVGEDMEQLEHTYTAGGRVKWPNYVGKAWQFLMKVKYTYPIWYSNPSYLPERNETCPYKEFYMKFIAALFLRAPRTFERETTQIP